MTLERCDCPHCGDSRSKVIRTYKRAMGRVQRRYLCCGCGERFSDGTLSQQAGNDARHGQKVADKVFDIQVKIDTLKAQQLQIVSRL